MCTSLRKIQVPERYLDVTSTELLEAKEKVNGELYSSTRAHISFRNHVFFNPKGFKPQHSRKGMLQTENRLMWTVWMLSNHFFSFGGRPSYSHGL